MIEAGASSPGDSLPPSESESSDTNPLESAQPDDGESSGTLESPPSQPRPDEAEAGASDEGAETMPAEATPADEELTEEAPTLRAEVADAGPTVTPGQWLGTEPPWPPGVRRLGGRTLLPPPARSRFSQLPMWASGTLLVGVAVLALLVAIVVARAAINYLPGLATPTPTLQHAPTPTPHHTATPSKR